MPLDPKAIPTPTVIRPAATKLSELPKDEQAIFKAIKKAIIAERGKCAVYAAGSRVRGNPRITEGNLSASSDFDIIITDISIQEARVLKAKIQPELSEKYIGLRIDIFTNISITPNILI